MDFEKAEKILKTHVPVGRRILIELEVIDSDKAIDLLEPLLTHGEILGCRVLNYLYDTSLGYYEEGHTEICAVRCHE
jgi:hypothetical protein